MEFGAFESTEILNPIYTRIKELGLESYVMDIDTYGFTVIPPEKVATPDFLERMRETVLSIAQERTGNTFNLSENGDSGHYKGQPQLPGQFLLYYFSFKYKGKKGTKALFYTDNHKLELIWTIIPAIVLTVFITFGLLTWSDVMNMQKNNDPMVVELYAQQFNWKARYAGTDNVLGKSNVRLIDIDKANILGLDENDPYAADDVITTELHLPVDRPVQFVMRSQDVIHSAYMPHFRAQMNCVPGMVTKFAFTPTVTTEEMRKNPSMIDKVININNIREDKRKDLALKGEEPLDPYEFDYLLLCNKICGKSHYNMQMKIIVETQEEFDNWY